MTHPTEDVSGERSIALAREELRKRFDEYQAHPFTCDIIQRMAERERYWRDFICDPQNDDRELRLAQGALRELVLLQSEAMRTYKRLDKKMEKKQLDAIAKNNAAGQEHRGRTTSSL